ncbi:hypothetical protein LTR37_011880 [Vermiconidia calcicola]|uniref:Uncharacterized protein n=1 Tax=Vermiconidia calcicola TaxID=1690605 RepID=A0ACC3N0Y7_9PEZI|nr:hypothetical protein LTR37_011880 [Vermiconidia calcicola]
MELDPKPEKTAKELKQLRQLKDKGRLQPDEEVNRKKQEDAAKRIDRLLAHARSLTVPEYANLDNLESADPDVYKLLLKEGVTVDKSEHSPFVNAAIWFNEVDHKHTFNGDFANCCANYAMASRWVGKANDIPEIQMYYLEFKHREAFISYWFQERDDIEIFSKTQVDTFNKFAAEEKACLDALSSMSIGGQGDAGADESTEDDDAMELERIEMEMERLKTERDDRYYKVMGYGPSHIPNIQQGGFSEWVVRTFLLMRDEITALMDHQRAGVPDMHARIRAHVQKLSELTNEGGRRDFFDKLEANNKTWGVIGPFEGDASVFRDADGDNAMTEG